MYQCPYCGTSFNTGLQPPPPQHHQTGPTFIVIAPGHDDDDDMHHHFHHAAQTHAVASGIGWLVWVIVMVVVVGGAGGGWAFLSRRSSFASSMIWDGESPFHCAGNDNVNVKGVNAQFNAGIAVTVSGNCHFTCTDCSIKAPTVFEVSGNGDVTVVNGSVIGTETLVEAGGNAHVNISGNVTAGGAVKQSANAKVSAPRPTAPPPAATPVAATTPAPAAATPTTPTTKAGTKATTTKTTKTK
jgi:hypothetical protein